MPVITKTLTQLEKDVTFFTDLKDGNFVLVLGAGFSYGVRNMVSENDVKKINKELKKIGCTKFLKIKCGLDEKNTEDVINEREKFVECGTIPLAGNFNAITNLLFFKGENRSYNYSTYANAWNNKGYKLNKLNLELFFRNLFKVDETDPNLTPFEFLNIPKWQDIFTLNFDTVIDFIISKNTEKYNQKIYKKSEANSSDTTAVGSTRYCNIHKLHDCINTTDLTSLVFGDKSYVKFTEPNASLYTELTKSILAKKKLIIIGTQFSEQFIDYKLFQELGDKISDVEIYHFEYANHDFIQKEHIYKHEKYYFIDFGDKANRQNEKEGTLAFLEFLKNNKDKIIKQELPNGVRLVKNDLILENYETNKFLKYLNEDTLPYYKRVSYKNSYEQNLEINFDGFITEDTIYNELNQGTNKGVIVEGVGGIGKTRLMIEVGKTIYNVNSVDNHVLFIDNDFTCNAISDLEKYISADPYKNYYLLIDGVKAFEIFNQSNLPFNQKLKFIANVFDFNGTINFSTETNPFKVLKIKNANAELSYRNALKKEIIKKLFPNNTNISKSTPKIPSLLVVLHSVNEGSNFTNSLTDIIETQLGNIVGTLSITEFSLPIFLSQLPNQKSNFTNDYKNVADELIKKGWIYENNTGIIRIVHETVIDDFLANYLDKGVQNLLKILHGSSHNIILLDSVLNNLERVLANTEIDNTTNFEKISSFIRLTYSGRVTFFDDKTLFGRRLPVTKIFNEKDRVNIIYKYKESLLPIIQENRFISALGFAMEHLSKTKPRKKSRTEDFVEKEKADFDELVKECNELFKIWFEKNDIVYFFNNRDFGLKFISGYFKLIGKNELIEDIFKMLLQNINWNEDDLVCLSMAICAYPKDISDENSKLTELLKQTILTWFNVFDSNKHVYIDLSFIIIKAIKLGLFEKIEDRIKLFLNSNNNDQVQHIYVVLAILKDNKINNNLNWFIELQKNVLPELIANNYVGNENLIQDIIKKLISRKNEDVIIPNLKQLFLVANKSAQLDNIRRYISLKLDLQLISTEILKYKNDLNEFVEFKNEEIINISHLKFKENEDYELVINSTDENNMKKAIGNYVSEYGSKNTKKTLICFTEYFEKQFNYYAIKDLLLEYLDENELYKTPEAIRLIGKMLEKENSKEDGKAYAIEWLKSNHVTENPFFIITDLMNYCPEEIEKIKPFIPNYSIQDILEQTGREWRKKLLNKYLSNVNENK